MAEMKLFLKVARNISMLRRLTRKAGEIGSRHPQITQITPIRKRQKAEGRGQRAEGRGAEGRGQRAEGRGQRAEGRGQKAEGRGQRAEGRGAEGRGQRAARTLILFSASAFCCCLLPNRRNLRNLWTPSEMSNKEQHLAKRRKNRVEASS